MNPQRCQTYAYQLSQQHIHYLDPIILLRSRYKFQKIHNEIMDVDIFPILFQISLRGGYEVVTNRNLWSEIHQSLVYSTLKIEEIKMLGFKYKSLLVKFEVTIQKQITRILLPHTQSLTGILLNPNKLIDQEITLMEQIGFRHQEEFACFRAIVLSEQRKTDIQNTHLELARMTDGIYAERIYDVFHFYLINFMVNLRIYTKLLEKPIRKIKQLRQINENKKIAVLGGSLRNLLAIKYLIAFGYRITLFLGDFESEQFYNPLFVEGGKFNPFVRLLDKQEIGRYDFGHCRVNYYHRNDISKADCLNKFMGLIQEVLKCDDNSLIDDQFKQILDKLLPRPTLIDEVNKLERSTLQFHFNRLILQSTLQGRLTTVLQLRQYLTNFDSRYISNTSEGATFNMLTTSIKEYFESELFEPTREKLKRKQLQSIKRIRLEGNTIQIEHGTKKNTFEYLIYGDNSELVSSLIGQDEIKDNPGFELQLLKSIPQFKQIQVEHQTKIMMQFYFRFWPKDQIFSLQNVEHIFFIDGQQHQNGNSQLLVIIPTKLVDFRKNQREYTIMLLEVLSQIFNHNNLLQLTLLDIQSYGADYFISNELQNINSILNPIGKLYFNIPLQNSTNSDLFSMTIQNSFKIINLILQDTETGQNDELKAKLQSKLPQQIVADPIPKQSQQFNIQMVKQVKMDAIELHLAPECKDQVNQIYGITHKFVKQFSKDQSKLFELHDPYEYYPGNYLISIGLEQPFTSLVRLPSLISGTLIYYYFTMLEINDQIIYAIVPEDNQEQVLYHSDINQLHYFIKQNRQFQTQNPIVINYDIRYKFPNIFSCLIKQRLTEVDLKLPLIKQLKIKMVLKVNSTQLVLENIDIGRLLFCVNHPVMRIIQNINYMLPQKILQIIQTPLIKGKYEMKVIVTNRKTIQIYRRFLSLKHCCFDNLYFEINYSKQGYFEYIVKIDNTLQIFSNLNELWNELYKQYIQLYECKFIYQTIIEMSMLDEIASRKYENWTKILNLMYSKQKVGIQSLDSLPMRGDIKSKLQSVQDMGDSYEIVNQKLIYCFNPNEQK